LIPVLLFGIAASVYMAWHHEVTIYSPEGARIVGCDEGAGVNCDLVNTSEWSEILGVPIALFGIPTYLVLGFLAVLGWRRRQRQALGYAFSISVLTVLYSAFLFTVSKTQLHFVCLWCLRLYLVNLAAFVLLWVAARASPLSLLAGSLRDLTRWPRAMRAGAGVFGGVLLLSLLAQHFYRASLSPDSGPAPSLRQADGVVRVGGDVALPDQKGVLPERSWTVVTEKGNRATLALRPDDAWKGNPEAAVVLVEFADFECGYCKRFSAEVKRFHEAYGDRVLMVFRHYVLDPSCNPGVKNRRHGRACLAAQAGICAQEQGRFWAFHDLAFKNQHQLEGGSLRAYAVKSGLDPARFDACVKAKASRQRVYEHGATGKALDIGGVPRLYINGARYTGARTAEAMARHVETLLGGDPAEVGKQALALREAAPPVPPIPDDVPSTRVIRYGELHFEIDTFEAVIEEGKAVSARGRTPSHRVTWFDAGEACEAAGRRLCTEREWLAACQGALPIDDDGSGHFTDDMIEGTAYPYSDFHQRGTCWDGNHGDDAKRPMPTGSFPGCVSRDGVYDLTGNVEEWVGESPRRALLLGGAYDTPEDKARCYRPNRALEAGASAIRTGFRCCRSIEDAP